MRYVLLIFALAFALESLWPAHRQGISLRWLLLAVGIHISHMPTLLLAQETWVPWFHAHPLVQAPQAMHPLLGGLVGFIVYQFIFYWWHRAKHANDFLWRLGHQMHHSPRRVEVLSAYFGHPVDGATNVFLSGLSVWFLLGLDVQAVAVFGLIETVYDIFPHTNVRTPRWVGYLIQRPEMHRLHHQRGVHGSNYGMPLFDLLFGTYVNPSREQEVAVCGFSPDKETRVLDMLLFRDVHAAPPASWQSGSTRPAATPET